MLDNSSHHIPLPEPVCTIYPGANLVKYILCKYIILSNLYIIIFLGL